MASDAPFEQDAALREFASAYGMRVSSARALVDRLRWQAGTDRFYVFWNAGNRAGDSNNIGRQRTLLAFTSPDAALAFAQRNHMTQTGSPARLRRLTMLQLIQAMLRAPAIHMLLIANDDTDLAAPVGQLPAGVQISRNTLLRQITEQS